MLCYINVVVLVVTMNMRTFANILFVRDNTASASFHFFANIVIVLFALSNEHIWLYLLWTHSSMYANRITLYYVMRTHLSLCLIFMSAYDFAITNFLGSFRSDGSCSSMEQLKIVWLVESMLTLSLGICQLSVSVSSELLLRTMLCIVYSYINNGMLCASLIRCNRLLNYL